MRLYKFMQDRKWWEDHEWQCVCGHVWNKGDDCQFILCGMEQERQRAIAKARAPSPPPHSDHHSPQHKRGSEE